VPEVWTVAESMHGVRPPDVASVGAWKSETENLQYSAELWPVIGSVAEPFCKRYSYEIPDLRRVNQKLAKLAGGREKMSESDETPAQNASAKNRKLDIGFAFKPLDGATSLQVNIDGLSENQAWDLLRRIRALVDTVRKTNL
jgi:hypothetical protein